VGDEAYISLTDLVADVRAATPSAAAELAVPDRRDVTRLVDDLSLRLASGLTSRTRLASERLARTADRLQSGVRTPLRKRHSQLERLAVQLDALSPLRVLGRGYAVPMTEDGRVLKRRAEFAADLRFRLRVADGDVRAQVE